MCLGETYNKARADKHDTFPIKNGLKKKVLYPLSYRVPVWERYGSTLLPATREQHDQNCTQSH